jgi:hypothetical protein
MPKERVLAAAAGVAFKDWRSGANTGTRTDVSPRIITKWFTVKKKCAGDINGSVTTRTPMLNRPEIQVPEWNPMYKQGNIKRGNVAQTQGTVAVVGAPGAPGEKDPGVEMVMPINEPAMLDGMSHLADITLNIAMRREIIIDRETPGAEVRVVLAPSQEL